MPDLVPSHPHGLKAHRLAFRPRYTQLKNHSRAWNLCTSFPDQMRLDIYIRSARSWEFGTNIHSAGYKQNKQKDVSFSCVRSVIDYEFRHNIVKVAPQSSTDYFDNAVTKFIISNRTDALKHASICFFYDNTHIWCMVRKFLSSCLQITKYST